MMIPIRSFTKWILIFAFGIAILGCQRSIDHNKQLNKQEEKYMHEQNQHPWQDGSEVFFILRTQQLVKAQKQPPDSFYIKGVIEGGRFLPKSNILGIGELGKNGRYGWFELLSKEFFPMESSKKAATPFVKGYLTDKGFIPSIREVFNEPQ